MAIFKIIHKKTAYRVKIARDFHCNCPSMTSARKTSCIHIVWVLTEAFGLENNDIKIAQLSIGESVLSDLLHDLPDELSQSLLEFRANSARPMHEKLKLHPKFNDDQVWYVARKSDMRPARCSGCMTPNAINKGTLHLYANGLLYIEKQDIVKAVPELRFCARRSCVTELKSSYNNIRPMPDGCVIKKDPLLDGLTGAEVSALRSENFTIEGLLEPS